MIRNIQINDTTFTLLDYTDHYKAVKRCSITKDLYIVQMSPEDFRRYYKSDGKHIDHFKELNEDALLFLETTCTPPEIATLTNAERQRLNKKLWRRYIKQPKEETNEKK